MAPLGSITSRGLKSPVEKSRRVGTAHLHRMDGWWTVPTLRDYGTFKRRSARTPADQEGNGPGVGGSLAAQRRFWYPLQPLEAAAPSPGPGSFAGTLSRGSPGSY